MGDHVLERGDFDRLQALDQRFRRFQHEPAGGAQADTNPHSLHPFLGPVFHPLKPVRDQSRKRGLCGALAVTQ